MIVDFKKLELIKDKVLQDWHRYGQPFWSVIVVRVITRWVCFNDPAWESSGWGG